MAPEVNIFLWVVSGVICHVIDIFGIVANIINIMCFIKQGFKETVNISLLGLAVSDIGCLITLAWINLSMTPAVTTADLTFDPVDVMYLTAGIPHRAFVRVSSWITAMITLERCLCIIAPLKVKRIVTPKRITVTVIAIFIVSMCGAAPVYVFYRLDYKYFPLQNKTLLGLVSNIDLEIFALISFAINFFLSVAAFVITIFCTITLVFALRQRRRWLETKTTSGHDQTVRQNQKVSKMVLMIAVLFISCFIPNEIIMLAMAFEPDISVGGAYIHISLVLGSCGLLLESVNSSANIFMYYNMSAKFKYAFQCFFFKSRPLGKGKSELLIAQYTGKSAMT